MAVGDLTSQWNHLSGGYVVVVMDDGWECSPRKYGELWSRFEGGASVLDFRPHGGGEVSFEPHELEKAFDRRNGVIRGIQICDDTGQVWAVVGLATQLQRDDSLKLHVGNVERPPTAAPGLMQFDPRWEWEEIHELGGRVDYIKVRCNHLEVIPIESSVDPSVVVARLCLTDGCGEQLPPDFEPDWANLGNDLKEI